MSTKNRVGKQPIVYCPLCQQRIKFRGDIDFSKFNGQVCCDKCGTLLGITISNNKVQGLKVITKGFRTLTSGELIRLYHKLKEFEKKVDEEGAEQLEKLAKQFSATLKPDSEITQT
jgi:hypothetical protein